MLRRRLLAAQLPIRRQQHWAEKCIDLALRQQRIAFYTMANMWLADTRAS